MGHRTDHAPPCDLPSKPMSITTAIIAVFLPLACIAAAAALMRLFDVKEATTAQAQIEAEKLLSQVDLLVKGYSHFINRVHNRV